MSRTKYTATEVFCFSLIGTVGVRFGWDLGEMATRIIAAVLIHTLGIDGVFEVTPR